MPRLLRVRQDYRSHTFTASVENDLSNKDMSLLYSQFAPFFGCVLGLSREACTEYTETVGRIGYINDGALTQSQFNDVRLNIDALLRTCDQDKLRAMAEMQMKDIFASTTISLNDKHLLTLFMPNVYCEGCDTEDHLIFYWAPYNALRKQDLKDSINRYSDTLFNACQPEVQTCAACRPQAYGAIATSYIYQKYSRHNKSNCRCAACGGRY